jgi:hypothetical protein
VSTLVSLAKQVNLDQAAADEYTLKLRGPVAGRIDAWTLLAVLVLLWFPHTRAQ